MRTRELGVSSSGSSGVFGCSCWLVLVPMPPPARPRAAPRLFLAGRPVSNSRDSVFRFCRATALGGVSILVTTSFLNYIHTAALHRYSPCLVSPQRTPLASTTPLAKGTQALTKG